MAFRTLGEVVLAAHRAEQANDDDTQPRPTGNGSSGHCVCGGCYAGDGRDTRHSRDDAGDVLSPMWIIQYFIAQRPR